MAIKIKLTRKQAWDADTALRFTILNLRSMGKRHTRATSPAMRKALARDLWVLRDMQRQTHQALFA